VNVSVNSEYAEMAEIVLCDVLPTILGCLLLGSHLLVHLGWIALRIWETCAAHSGYVLPWCPFSRLALFNGPQVHDFHHSHNVGTYGAMTRFWDAVMVRAFGWCVGVVGNGWMDVYMDSPHPFHDHTFGFTPSFLRPHPKP
jgi:hypothetical protein